MDKKSQRSAFKMQQIWSMTNQRFECCAAEGKHVFVGTNLGAVNVLEVTSNGESSAVQIIPVGKTKKQAIQQIAVLADIGRVLIVVEGNVVVYTFNKHERMPVGKEPCGVVAAAKDCSVIAVKKENRQITLAAVCKRRIVICQWREEPQSFELDKDYNLPDVARTLHWSGASLLLGFKKEYSLFDIATGIPTALCETGRALIPCATTMEPVRETLITIQDNLGVRLKTDGLPAASVGINWSNPPNSVCYMHPYVLSIVDRNCIEVHYPHTRPAANAGGGGAHTMVQMLPLKHASAMATLNMLNLDLPLPTERLGVFTNTQNDTAYLFTGEGRLFALEMVPIENQVVAMFQAELFDDALNLCRICINRVTPQVYTELLLQHGNHFFAQRAYTDAIGKFSEADADVRTVISYFNGYLAAVVKDVWQPKIAIEKQAVIFDNKPDIAVAVLMGFIAPKRKAPPPDTDSPIKAGKVNTYDEFTLMQCAIDTALIHCYVDLKQYTDVADLLNRSNWCIVEECEAAFIADGDFASLALLWMKLNDARGALNMLRSVGMYGKHVPEMGVGRSLSGTNVVELFRRWRVAEDVPTTFQAKNVIEAKIRKYAKPGDDVELIARQLTGVTATMHFIKQLDGDEFQHVINENAAWILENFPPEYAVRMYIEAPKRVPPTLVVAFMEQSKDMSPTVCAKYLELALGGDVNAVPDADLHNRRVAALLRVIASDEVEQGRGQKAAIKELNHFLAASRYYSPAIASNALKIAKHTKLFVEERALVYRRLGQHAAAINMFLELGKPDAAERYAQMANAESVDVHGLRTPNTTGDDAFRHLLLAHLAPAGGERPRVDEALRLVRKNPTMDVTTVLDVMPLDVPIAELSEFFAHAIRAKHAQGEMQKVRLNLLKTAERQAKADAIKARRVAAFITSETPCAVCKKKIRDTVFARYPNGVVVHQACLGNERQVCAQTKVDFRQTAQFL
jgi:hypothetical protein